MVYPLKAWLWWLIQCSFCIILHHRYTQGGSFKWKSEVHVRIKEDMTAKRAEFGKLSSTGWWSGFSLEKNKRHFLSHKCDIFGLQVSKQIACFSATHYATRCMCGLGNLKFLTITLFVVVIQIIFSLPSHMVYALWKLLVRSVLWLWNRCYGWCECGELPLSPVES